MSVQEMIPPRNASRKKFENNPSTAMSAVSEHSARMTRKDIDAFLSKFLRVPLTTNAFSFYQLETLFASLIVVVVILLLITAGYELVPKNQCVVRVPDENNDCCVCICDLEPQLCNFTSNNSHVPFGNNNRMPLTTYADVASFTAVLVGCCLILIQLAIALRWGNWYQLAYISIVTCLECVRSLLDSHPGGIILYLDYTAFALSLLIGILVFRMRSSFGTVRFERFGFSTKHQWVINRVESLMGALCMDLQLSLIFYVQCAALSNSNEMILVCFGLAINDIIATVSLFVYIPMERLALAAISIFVRVAAMLAWYVILVYYGSCFVKFKADALFFKYFTLQANRTLFFDAESIENYFADFCVAKEAIQSSATALFAFLVLFLAGMFRLVACYLSIVIGIFIHSDRGSLKKIFFSTPPQVNVAIRAEVE